MNPTQKLLVLYTGGTIGMQMSEAGLAPASGFEARLRAEQAAHPERPVPAWRFGELLPPLDSANMTQANWLAMRDAIVHAVDEDGCDAVLLLHGTDTLAYSAAALSFLLLGLNVPVVLTGSMQPAGVAGSDAWPNLFGALALLAHGVAPGVHLYFNGQLLHGACASKLKSEAFDAFADHQRPRHGRHLNELPAALHYRQPRQPVRLAVQPLFPGLAAEQLRALLSSDVQGVLLECYGSGTGPSDNPAILAALSEAHARGVVLAAISQCPQGHVEFGVYAAGSALAATGLVSGAGMGREAALGKLFSLLGAGLSQAEVERLFALDLCGELAE
ncbi:asparaginase [Aquipseudomonas ullengensis]|uniref:Asparaginase n=1 Tax=Aquipseudomonas ullengensis TaxID=2759166 RepID=A0A7W4Q8W2_9GAMM|nr:asparaginase [Pseudomonas ullengensis]MBB2494177.1 asparaginase [Pseudomonas ullengensis]